MNRRLSFPRFLSLGLVLGLAASMTAAEDSGFTPLLNGKNLDGWKAFYDPKAKDVDTSKNLKIVDGAIVCSGKPTGFFHTDKAYSNYVLQYEWRYPKGSDPKSNSGCLVHLQEPLNKIFPKCLEPQGRYYDHGRIFVMHHAKEDIKFNKFDQELITKQLKPMGEWSKTEVTCTKDGLVKVKLNGEQVSECQGVLTSGPIGFQSEGTEVHFRNIRIKKLD